MCRPNNSDVKLTTQTKEAMGSKYLFEEITGEIVTNRNAEVFAKTVIQRAKKENKDGVFFFSSNMASRSFSLPEITLVLDCYDGGSIFVAHQKHSRALTPGVGKNHGYIINMSIDPNRGTHFESKLILDTVHDGYATVSDIKERIARRLRLQKLFFWNEDDDTQELIQADDIERIALDADRVVDMLMYNEGDIINEIRLNPDLQKKIGKIAATISDLDSLNKKIGRLLNEDEPDTEIVRNDDTNSEESDSSSDQPAEGSEKADDEKKTDSIDPSDVRKLLANLVIIVQNIGLQFPEEDADDIFSALEKIKEEGLDDALRLWTKQSADELGELLKALDSPLWNSAFRVSRTGVNFDWLNDIFPGGE